MNAYWPLSSLYLLYFCVVGGMVPYWALYLQHLGFSPAHMGILLAVPLLTKILLPNLWSWLAQSSGHPQRIMQLGVLGATLCFAMVCLQRQFAGLLLWLVLYTSFWNAVLPQFEALTLAHLGTNGHLYSRIRLWGSIGFVVVAVALGPVFDVISIGWLPLMLLAGLVALGLATLFTPSAPQKIPPSGSAPCGLCCARLL